MCIMFFQKLVGWSSLAVLAYKLSGSQFLVYSSVKLVQY